ncbi:sulfatase-like hydrolase/transferase [Halosimplex pelagicum]|uniref:Sulfatase-like hydrolase/transferase n=1 Tax=Halosimplex pelagicum TaxID=869886 RepID=A0A7D5P6H2_9EURY|nr:sulfatase-like hydrolase/transferase [Halosimplex pelagicum]
MNSSPVERPNILFVLTDQQRLDWVGSGSDVPVRTPNLDRLADSGVHFENAVCPAPLCGPSRYCLASGMEYHNCSVDSNEDYPFDRPTYYARLRDDADYETIGVGDIDLHMDSPTWGLDGTASMAKMGFSVGGGDPGQAGDGCHLSQSPHRVRLLRRRQSGRRARRHRSGRGPTGEPIHGLSRGRAYSMTTSRTWKTGCSGTGPSVRFRPRGRCPCLRRPTSTTGSTVRR